MYIDGFIQPLLYGMCDSLQPAVGFNWGAGDYGRVKAIEKRCFTASALLSLVFSAVIFFFPAQAAGLFMQGSEPGVLEMAVPSGGDLQRHLRNPLDLLCGAEVLCPPSKSLCWPRSSPSPPC